MKLSVIIPVYNASDTLSGSLNSLQCLRPDEVEIVFINDGSTDSTLCLLESYRKTARFSSLIISQENAGVAAARNRGLEEASGDYLAFLDADDRWEDGALDRILSLTDEGDDIIGWDFSNVGDDGIRIIRQAGYVTTEAALRNLMGGTMKWNLWLFAVKRELILQNDLRFLPGADMGEDMQFMLKAFACADRVIQVHEPLYRYNASNPSSISAQMNGTRREEVTRNLKEAELFLSRSRHSALFVEFLPHLKLFIKLPLLISLSMQDYETWYGWFPEANDFATRNHALPFRVRLLQGMAARRLWGFVRLYNRFVYQFVYPLFVHSGE